MQVTFGELKVETNSYRARRLEERDYSTFVTVPIAVIPDEGFIPSIQDFRGEVIAAVSEFFEPVNTHEARFVTANVTSPEYDIETGGMEAVIVAKINFAKPSEILEEVSLKGLEKSIEKYVHVRILSERDEEALRAIEAELQHIRGVKIALDLRKCLVQFPDMTGDNAYALLPGSFTCTDEPKRMLIEFRFQGGPFCDREVFAQYTLQASPGYNSDRVERLAENFYLESYASVATSSAVVTIAQHREQLARRSRYFEVLEETEKAILRIVDIALENNISCPDLLQILRYKTAMAMYQHELC